MTETQISPKIFLPQINLPDELESTLPLEHTDVAAQVTGPLCSVTVTQRFGNPLKEAAELDYLFPLPEDAAVTGFELVIGARRIQGDLQELEAARETYENARGAGKRAGLLEQKRPNLFSVRLANVRPAETILATLHYQQRLKFEDDAYELVFPMGLTPKYDSPKNPGEGHGVHAPLAPESAPVGPVEIQVSVDAGVDLMGEPTSPSHPLAVTRLDERRFQVRLAGQHIPNKDFVLRYPVAGETLKAAGWISSRAGQEVFLATLVPPRLEEEGQALPREFVFVLDRSGSMSGEPILQARNALRACLRTLNPEDTFRILLFDDKLEWYRSEPLHLNQQELERADGYLSKVNGRGGTEIVGAIEAALQLPADPQRVRFVVFLTDGAVSAEERALEQIRGRIGQARVFTFGIGPSVNRALLSRMARLGRGRAEFLQLNEDIEGAIIRFQDSVSFPALTDLALQWEHGKAWDIYPGRLPDLYVGQPLEICGFLARESAGPVNLTVTGQRNGQPVTLKLALAGAGGAEPVIERVWARARVDDLQEQQALMPSQAGKIRAEILGLALAYHLVTDVTAFVAVDTDPGVAGGQPRVIHVAQPLPEGLSREGFMAGGPQVMRAMSMPASPIPASRPRSMTQSGGDPQEKSIVSKLFKRISSRADRDTRSLEQTAEPEQTYGLGQAIDAAPAVPDRPGTGHGEEALRWLARTQRADGSWEGDVEQTAAALLAFIRAGQTTRSGAFRTMLRKAVQWLRASKPAGLAAFVRARALEELALATGDSKDGAEAQSAKTGLPSPSSRLEAAALDRSGQPPQAVKTLDDLRMAALLNASLPVTPELLQGPQAGLASTWAAALPQ